MTDRRAMSVPIAVIRRDGGTQMRAHMSDGLIGEYAEAMARGDRFPPIELAYDETSYWLIDGYHRLQAAERAGLNAISAEVRPGTRRDAILAAVGANATHGLRRSNADKRASVLTMVNDPEWCTKSDREIARTAGVDVGMVGRLRPSSGDKHQATDRRQVTRGGKRFEMDVSAINRGRDAPDAAASAAAPPVSTLTVAPRGSRQLRVFLGELRQGADLRSAAYMAELSMGEAQLHLEAEQSGEYADVLAIEPLRDVGRAAPAAAPQPINAAPPPRPAAPPDDAGTSPEVQHRDAVLQALSTIAAAPDPAAFLDLWVNHAGQDLEASTVVRVGTWMSILTHIFPAAAERRRQQAKANPMENH